MKVQITNYKPFLTVGKSYLWLGLDAAVKPETAEHWKTAATNHILKKGKIKLEQYIKYLVTSFDQKSFFQMDPF